MNASAIINLIESEQKKKEVPKFNVGDTVKVHTRVIEGDKERTQIFQGIVISRERREQYAGSFTVRKISYGEGVERKFPVHSPRVSRVEVLKHGKVRRAKLYYLRKRMGKEATNIKEANTSASA